MSSAVGNECLSVLSMDRELVTTVSQQFVLQFYTIMSKQPGSLHRFYKEDSVLVRGSSTVRGQEEIHTLFAGQGLSDCRAVVLSLDAVRAFDKSVLIQVTGEIASRCEDMRRFMQSFVLVEQEPGSFYVLCDVFRYQDETFRAEEAVQEEQDQKEEVEAEEKTWNDVSLEILNPEVQVQISPMISEHEENRDEFATYQHIEEKEELDNVVEEESVSEIGQKLDDMTIKEKSWAAIISPTGNRASKPTAPVAPQPQITKPIQQKGLNSNGENFEKRKQRYYNASSKAPTSQAPMNYPDDHQLFVGNLPQNMTEDELKDFFSSTYGPVKYVRIQKSRTSNDGKALPNFGFLVFQNQDVVMEILKNKPIYYSSHRLNVEQKMGASSRGPIRQARR